ncbi:MAG TPA: glycosyltransferase, partial [Gemmatimonadaceae bacterium]|nr:glycosyltransferase [Gemmatimonadaceae bacterium]
MTPPPRADAAQRLKGSAVLQPAASRPEVSVLVPAKDEAENLPLFMEQCRAVFAATPGRYEVVVIDDGSADDSWSVL